MPPLLLSALDQLLLPPSSSSPFPPTSLDDLLFAAPSGLDTHLLTQALTRELSSCKYSPSPSLSSSSSSEKSSGELHSQFLQGARMNGLLQQNLRLSQDGRPPSNTWVCKEHEQESPLNTDVSGISSIHNSSPTKGIDNQSQERCHGNTFLDSMKATQPGILPNSQASTRALSSQASAGAGTTKVSKRRSRANKKPPITVLSASTSNFRAMVQQLTGIPIPNSSNLSLLKPQPTRLPCSGSALNLPTLDTSASLLGRKWSQLKAPTQDFSLLQRLPHAGSHIAGKPDENVNHIYDSEMMLSSSLPGLWDAITSGNHLTGQVDKQFGINSLPASSSPSPGLWDAINSGNHLKGQVDKQFGINSLLNEGHTAIGNRRPCASMEFSLMDDHQVFYNTVDSWFAFDGGALASPSPRVEVAKLTS